MKYTTIFLDLDDTLIDTVLNSRQVLEDIYTDYSYNIYYKTFDDFFAKYRIININLWDQYEHNLITKDTLQKERFKQTFANFRDIDNEESLKMNADFMNRVSNKNNIIEGAIDILEYLSSKYPLYIISNGFIEVQDKKIKNAGLNKYFKGVFLSDHVGKNKPHPAIFNYALQEANTSIENCIMIGDNIKTDILGSKNIGIDQIWYNPNNSEDTNNIAPTHTIKKLYEDLSSNL